MSGCLRAMVETTKSISGVAKTYVSAVVILGALVTFNELSHWESQDVVRFLCYFALAIFASRAKLSLPAISGALSVLFIFILFSVVELTLPEALLIGCGATFLQHFWSYRTRPKLHQTLFNVGSVALAISAANHAYHSTLLAKGHLEPALRLLVTACVFFVMNT